MELTYTDLAGNDLGALDFASADFAWGADENDFTVKLSPASGIPQDKAYVYCEGTDIGGIVRGDESDGRGSLTITGNTWTGELDAHTLMPPTGQAYFRVSGDLNECIRKLLSQLGMTWLFSAPNQKTGIQVNHTFKGSQDSAQQDTGRYMGGWAALWQMLIACNAKVSMRWDPATKRVIISGSHRGDYTDNEELAASKAIVSVKRTTAPNHLICLGKGEMAARTVVHIYADKNGNISTKQLLFGRDEISDVYDNSSAEDAAELRSDGIAKLKELREDAQEVSVSAKDNVDLDVGDLVGGTDTATGVSAQAIITKKVVTFDGQNATADYETAIRS